LEGVTKAFDYLLQVTNRSGETFQISDPVRAPGKEAAFHGMRNRAMARMELQPKHRDFHDADDSVFTTPSPIPESIKNSSEKVLVKFDYWGHQEL
jgi:hypothetical protein